jgi:hypothetical protein
MKESDHSSGSYTDLRFIYRYSTLCIRARPLAPVRKSKGYGSDAFALIADWIGHCALGATEV